MPADLRLRQIAFASHDMDRAAAQLTAAFALPSGYNDPGIIHYGLKNIVLRVGGDFLEIVEPVRPDASAARYLDRRGGDSGYMVILQAEDAHAHRERTEALGARIVDVLDHREHKAIHFHPREFDGVLVSIDAAPGHPDWRDPASFWHPAGPDWPTHDPGPAHGIADVAIASPDPDATAARWARMLDAEVSDRQIKLLRSATIRFIQGTPGIAALSIAVEDPAAVLRRATDAGIPIENDAFVICNVPIRPTRPDQS
jgi:hypothetical protein